MLYWLKGCNFGQNAMVTETDQSERRIGRRIPSNQPLYFCDTAGWGSLCLGSLRNRSSGGLCIQTDSPQSVGTRIDLEFLATPENGQENTLLSRGEVCYVGRHGSNGYILGIKNLYNARQTQVQAAKAAPDRPMPRVRKITAAVRPVKSIQPKKVTPKQLRPKPDTGRNESRIWKPLLVVALILLGLLFLLMGSEQSSVKRADLPRGLSYAYSIGTAPEEAPDSYNYASTLFDYQALDSSDDLDELEVVPAYFRGPQDTFLFASFDSGRPHSRDDGKQQASPVANTRPDERESLSPVEQLARNLERAQSSMRTGNRMAALYLTRNSAETAADLPGPWREVLRQFRARLISHPDEIPALPKLDDWVTLSSSLANVPVDAPVVVYVDKDAFVMHVVKNGETVWQFPVGLGANDSTPEGIFTIGTKISNPDWYNRGDVVATGSPDNPLGDRWMGLSDGNTPSTYGIHPTDESNSIGQALSKGCIRMRPQDARRLYNMVPVGTPIVIRSGGTSPKL